MSQVYPLEFYTSLFDQATVVDLAITAPPGTRLDLDTGAGSVAVQGPKGGVKVHTGAGSITALDLAGGVEL